ncbi:MAG: type II secretion system protein GspG [Candidatus Sumerlaeaceae bacterium]|nr:type II secretion system protein GspG [Candidatus Sumerlaeaceae bacterium]
MPNFLEAQTRSKVSRAKADIRSLATALESYAVDNNNFPPDITSVGGMQIGTGWYFYISHRLTTPVAYITSNMLTDPFRDRRTTLPPEYWRFRYVCYGMLPYYEVNGVPGNVSTVQGYRIGEAIYGKWRISSAGPDATAGPYPMNNDFARVLVLYDPTNGTVSGGDIVRSQRITDNYQPPY